MTSKEGEEQLTQMKNDIWADIELQRARLLYITAVLNVVLQGISGISFAKIAEQLCRNLM